MKKRFIGCIIMMLVFLSNLTSCASIGHSPEELLQPPKPTGDYVGVQQALEAVVTDDTFTLKYPETGQYRSAFIQQDVDGDDEKEFLAFYAYDRTKEYHLNLIKKIDGAWRSIDDVVIGVAEGDVINNIDRADFSDLDGDGVCEIITGWSSISKSEKQLYAFKVENGKLVVKITETYSEYDVLNLYPDKGNDLLILKLNESEKRATANILRLDGYSRVLGQTALDGNVTSYGKISVGEVVDGVRGAYIDAYKGANAMITELIYFDEAFNLINPFYDPKEKATQHTMREVSYPCRDIDGHGVIEIPKPSVLPGYEDAPVAEKQYLTEWRKYQGTGDDSVAAFQSVAKTYMNYTDNYCFFIPEQWLKNKVSVKSAVEDRSRVFYIWNSETRTFGDPLLRIQAIAKNEIHREGETSDIKLGERDGQIYYARLFNTRDSNYRITREELLGLFQILT